MDWERITGVASRSTHVDSNQKIGVQFLVILNEIIGLSRGIVSQPLQSLVEGVNEVTVPPYIHEMRISLFKSTLQPGSLSAQQPDGSILDENHAQVTIENRDRPIEIWRIRNPQPGRWEFTVPSSDDHIDVFLDMIPIDVVAEIASGDFVQYDDISVNFRMVDANNQPIIQYAPPYQLDVSAYLVTPDGTNQLLGLAQLPDSQYETAFMPTQSGMYTLGIRATTQDISGNEFVVFEQVQAAQFNILNVIFEPVTLPSDTILAGTPFETRIRLVDAEGSALNDSSVAVTGEITPMQIQYPFTSTADGEYIAQIPLENLGDFTLTIRANAQRDIGNIALAPPLTTAFNVVPSQRVDLVRQTPLEGETTQYTTEGIPPFTPTDVSITFDVLVDGITPINLTDIVQDSNAVLWSVDILRDNEPFTEIISEIIADTSQVGRYHLRMKGLGEGHYEVEISAQDDLTGTYVFENNRLSTQIIRVTNPLYYVTIGLIVIAIVGAAVYTALSLRLSRQRRKHPAKGELVVRVEGEPDNILWQIKLDGFRSNHIVIKDKKLRKAGVTQLIVTCGDERMSQAKRVKVTIKNGRETIQNERLISPGTTVRLTKSSGTLFDGLREEGREYYELVKDPD